MCVLLYCRPVHGELCVVHCGCVSVVIVLLYCRSVHGELCVVHCECVCECVYSTVDQYTVNFVWSTVSVCVCVSTVL